MIWIRSLAALVIGGCLSFALSCAGDIALSYSAQEASSTKVMSLEPGRTLEMHGGGAPLSASESAAVAHVQAITDSVALRPVPARGHILATLLGTLVAGFFAAEIARHAPVVFGALSAWPLAVLTMIFLIAANGAEGMWASIGLTVLAAASGALGGWWWGRAPRRYRKGTRTFNSTYAPRVDPRNR